METKRWGEKQQCDNVNEMADLTAKQEINEGRISQLLLPVAVLKSQ
jgi:hypothetical protein